MAPADPVLDLDKKLLSARKYGNPPAPRHIFASLEPVRAFSAELAEWSATAGAYGGGKCDRGSEIIPRVLPESLMGIEI
jgi:hypothetical protein